MYSSFNMLESLIHTDIQTLAYRHTDLNQYNQDVLEYASYTSVIHVYVGPFMIYVNVRTYIPQFCYVLVDM